MSTKAERIELAVLSSHELVHNQSPGYNIPDWALAHINKAKKGSYKGAIAAKCSDCSCYQQTEIRYCTVVGCPLWAFRPYQPDSLTPEQEKALRRFGMP